MVTPLSPRLSPSLPKLSSRHSISSIFSRISHLHRLYPSSTSRRQRKTTLRRSIYQDYTINIHASISRTEFFLQNRNRTSVLRRPGLNTDYSNKKGKSPINFRSAREISIGHCPFWRAERFFHLHWESARGILVHPA